MVVLILKIYFIVTIVIMLIYAIRHFVFTYNRLFVKQKISYRDIYTSDLPMISVLIPMHNEELVLQKIISALLECDYDPDRLEIIAINDHSEDATHKMLDEYFSEYPFIRPLHRDEGARGKPEGLNDALQIAKGEIIIVFDADYIPSKNLLKKIAISFCDPQVGAVMGRVVPLNPNTNVLTNLLNLERSGGYQVDQQARFNMNLIPQYGGTVGGFRKKFMMETGGFNTRILAEDTELTYRLYTSGYKVVYDNSAECYEEVPETWEVRGRQVRRWSRGHNEVLFRYLLKVLFTKHLHFWRKVDGVLLLLVYAIPFLLGLALLDCIALFFLGEMNIFNGWWVLLFIGAYNAWGNFAPFYEIGAGALLDGMGQEITVLPMLCFSFYFYMWNISLGFLDAVVDTITQRGVKWAKTERFAKTEEKTSSTSETVASSQSQTETK